MRTKKLALSGAALALLLPAIASAAAEKAGMIPRKCPFDLDGDGVYGEAGECDFCDDTVDASGKIVRTHPDPDHDGADEDIFDIDFDNGTDTPSCGVPGNAPCRTLAYAIATRGNDTGEEDIYCDTGTASVAHGSAVHDLVLTRKGVEGEIVVEKKHGDQVRDFEHPGEPAMLVGWDRDGDDCYPPFDDGSAAATAAGCSRTADVTKLDGANGSSQYERLFNCPAGGWDNVEIAGQTVRNYAENTRVNGDTHVADFSCSARHVWIHDNDFDGFGKGSALGGRVRVWGVWPGDNRDLPYPLRSLDVSNNTCRNCGGFHWRGSFGNDVGKIDGPIRLSHETYSCFACAPGVCTSAAHDKCQFIKIWGTADGIEISNNRIDGQPDAWSHARSGTNFQAIAANACLHDVAIIGNELRNWRTHVGSAPGAVDAGVCQSRSTTQFRILRNDMRNTLSRRYIAKNARFIEVEAGTVAKNGTVRYLSDLAIENNAMASTNPMTGSQGCAEVYMGYGARACGANTRGGTFVYRQNTCALRAAEGRELPALNLVHTSCGGFARCYIENNLTSYPYGGGLLTLAAASCTTLSMRGNVWPEAATTTPFRLKGGGYGMRDFLAGPGSRDRKGSPKWKDGASTVVPASGDLHLHPGDTAAIGKGAALTPICIAGQKAGTSCTKDTDCTPGLCLTDTLRDIDQSGADRGIRPTGGGWDAGCDEVTSSGAGTSAGAAKPAARGSSRSDKGGEPP